MICQSHISHQPEFPCALGNLIVYGKRIVAQHRVDIKIKLLLFGAFTRYFGDEIFYATLFNFIFITYHVICKIDTNNCPVINRFALHNRSVIGRRSVYIFRVIANSLSSQTRGTGIQ